MAKQEKPFFAIHHPWLFFLLLLLLSQLFSISHPNVIFHVPFTAPSLLHHLSNHLLIQSSTWTIEAAIPSSWLFLTGISMKKKMKMMMRTTPLMKLWLSSMEESTTNAMTILNPFGTMQKSPPAHSFMEYCNVQSVSTTSSTRFSIFLISKCKIIIRFYILVFKF